MDITVRHWPGAGLTAAMIAAGAVAAPMIGHTPEPPGAATHSVRLVAGDVPWDQVLQTALANATDIYDHFSPAAFADLQQFAANVPAYLEGTRNFDTDLGLAYTAATSIFLPSDPEPYVYSSVDTTPTSIDISALGTHLFDIPLGDKADLLNDLTNGLSFDVGPCPLCVPVHIDLLSALLGQDAADEVKPYLEFAGSPLSGILWGSFGTTVGPLLQLNDDIAAITSALTAATPDYTAALDDVADIPANVTNAFLNGYGDIELGDLLTTFGLSVPGLDVNGLSVDLGGLLSPAGSLINGIAIVDTVGDCGIGCASLDIPSSMVGPIASLFLQDQAIAEAIGWDGVGQPLAALFSQLSGMLT